MTVHQIPSAPCVRNGILAWLSVCGVLSLASAVQAQSSTKSPPEPIYWRQNLLTVPYQWNSTGGGAQAKSVWLYVSKDRGASWQRVGDAQPQLLAFNYRAPADGEYWFAIRTSDADNRDALYSATLNPNVALVPELCVIVDTSMPRIESLTGQLRDATNLEVRWRVRDANLSAHSCNVEVLAGPTANWQPVPLAGASEVSPGVWEGIARFSLNSSSLPVSVRATAVDLAGNRAVFQSPVSAGNSDDQRVDDDSVPSTDAAGGLVSNPSFHTEPGWVSSSAPSLPIASSGPAEPQVWPADRIARVPFGASDEGQASVAYDTPVDAGAAAADSLASSPGPLDIPVPKTEDRPLGNVPAERDLELGAEPTCFAKRR